MSDKEKVEVAPLSAEERALLDEADAKVERVEAERPAARVIPIRPAEAPAPSDTRDDTEITEIRRLALCCFAGVCTIMDRLRVKPEEFQLQLKQVLNDVQPASSPEEAEPKERA